MPLLIEVGGLLMADDLHVLRISALQFQTVKWTPEAIRAARQDRGWSQQELADELGVSLRSVNDWERGTSSPRNTRVLDRVLDRIEVDETRGPRLRDATDSELAFEMLRRLESRRPSEYRPPAFDPDDPDKQGSVYPDVPGVKFPVGDASGSPRAFEG
jgi:transcriptional regulator with XRE-family HTH domain